MSTNGDAQGEESMHINSQRAEVLAENLGNVLTRVEKVAGGRKACPADLVHVRVIAVSKLKPANDILALHQKSTPRLEHFGENYAQELTEKAGLLPKSIRWHMIGALQTNKCKPLAEQVSNLYCVSSVDTAKKADALEKGRAALAGRQELPEKLRVLVQVNTSGEAEKSGIEPDQAVELCNHVREQCPHLYLAGVMTIGAIARSQASTNAESINEDFVCLREVRDKIAQELGISKEELELSMGMSSDFEAAIAQGSDEVRIGTTIFGDRPAKKDAKIKEERVEEK